MNSESKKLLQSKDKNFYISNDNSFITNKFQIFIIILFLLFCIDSTIKNYTFKNSLERIEKKLLNESENKNINEQNILLKKSIQNNPSINILSSIELLKLMTNNDENKYNLTEKCLLNDNELCVYRFLCPKEVVGKKRLLIGKKAGGGGYVLLDDFKNIKIAYYFGESNKNDFNEDLANRDINVYIYDQTIKSFPNKNPKLHWKKIGLGQKTKKNKNIMTINELISENDHTSEQNMILKMDIELEEWNILKDLSEDILEQFKYIVLELHFENDAKLYYEALKKINKTHQVFFLHCNNGGNIVIFGNNRICEFLQVSFVNRKDNEFTKDNSIYPIQEFENDINLEKIKSEMNLNIFKLFDNL